MEPSSTGIRSSASKRKREESGGNLGTTVDTEPDVEAEGSSSSSAPSAMKRPSSSSSRGNIATNSSTSSHPTFHHPPEKRFRRSTSPVLLNPRTTLSVSCPTATSLNRSANSLPIDLSQSNVSSSSTCSTFSRQHVRHVVGPAVTTASFTEPRSTASVSLRSSPQPPSTAGGSASPRRGASPQPPARKQGTQLWQPNLEGTGVGILRDGAGWPGFGSEEEMGMSSSGAEEDERNNKYTGFEWEWDDNAKSSACCLAKMKTEVRFHLDYSCGTAAARGSELMRDGQFYWEVKMVSPVYGTDMMIGVGTKQVDLNQYSRAFCSMLGHEAGSESCGLSYTGRFQKGGVGRMYCSKFGQGAIIGMHLDMWFGTLTYYKNGKRLGIAARNLMNKTWYPIVSSTAARSSMRLVKTKSFPSNLQFWCCQALRKAVPPDLNVLDVLELPPGLKNYFEDSLSWLLRAHEAKVEVECKTQGTQTVLSMMASSRKDKGVDKL
ncbi:uncharacterized protein [Diadema antillarum]|uniref:uncharacterized protein n=1 Tax=Diadema antillarum TaxID=105358 RepID=UPI003A866464